MSHIPFALRCIPWLHGEISRGIAKQKGVEPDKTLPRRGRGGGCPQPEKIELLGTPEHGIK